MQKKLTITKKKKKWSLRSTPGQKSLVSSAFQFVLAAIFFQITQKNYINQNPHMDTVKWNVLAISWKLHTWIALLSGSETFVHYTVQIYYPVREKLCSFSRCALVA